MLKARPARAAADAGDADHGRAAREPATARRRSRRRRRSGASPRASASRAPAGSSTRPAGRRQNSVKAMPPIQATTASRWIAFRDAYSTTKLRRRGTVARIVHRRGSCQIATAHKPRYRRSTTGRGARRPNRMTQALLGVRHRKQGRGAVLPRLRHGLRAASPAAARSAQPSRRRATSAANAASRTSRASATAPTAA